MDRTQALSLALTACAACADVSSAQKLPKQQSDRPEAAMFMDGSLTSDWKPLAATESYEGKTLAEWAVAYMQWRMAPNSCDIPAFDQDGSRCADFQDPESPMFFMDFSPTKRLRTECKVPADKALFVPIMWFFNDNVGVEPPLDNDELIEGTSDVLDSMRDLQLRFDNTSSADMSSRKIEPLKFEYALPSTPNWYSCNGTPGVENVTIDPSYFAGYVAIFPPPKPGVHELQYAGVLTWNGDDLALDTRSRFVVED